MIADFLQVNVTKETIAEIARQCDIDNHRKGFLEHKDDKYEMLKTTKVDGNPVMFRKGNFFYRNIVFKKMHSPNGKNKSGSRTLWGKGKVSVKDLVCW